MKCYLVKCVDSIGNQYNVGVMTFDALAAKHCAEFSLKEGQHVVVKAIEAIEVEGI